MGSEPRRHSAHCISPATWRLAWVGWLLLVAGLLPALADTPMAREEIHAAITALAPGEGATREATIDRGSADGLVAGWRGVLWARHSKQDGQERDVQTLGTAVVLALTPHAATVRLTLSNPAGDGDVRAGDFVAINARVPALPRRSLLWRLAKLHITLMDENNAKSYNDYTALYRDETAAGTEAIYAAMLKNIAWTGGEYGDIAAPKPIVGGRYDGKTLRQVMEGATRGDLDNFFLFVAGYPGKYLAKSWKLNEVFATWVINAAPVGQEELRGWLITAPTPAQRTELIAHYRKDIVDGGMVAEWYSDAQSLADDGHINDALALAEAAIAAARQLNRVVDASWCLFAKAYVLREAERYPEALTAFDTALAAFRARKPLDDDAQKGIAFCLSHRGGILSSLTRYKEALPLYTESLQIRQRVPALHNRQGTVYWSIGHAHYNLGEYTQSIAAYEQALPFMRTGKDTADLTNLLSWMAKVYARVGDNAGAQRVYTEAIEISRREQARAAEAELLGKLASHHWGLGRYADALAAFQQALSVQRGMDAQAEIGVTLTGIGKLYWNLGEYDKSLAAHTEALGIRRVLKERAGEAESLKELGDLAKRSGEYPTALQHYVAARELAAALGDQQREATVSTAIADLYQQQQKFTEALDIYNRIVTLYTGLGMKADQALALYNRAVQYERVKRLPEAEKDYRAALALQQAISARADEADTLLALSTLAWRQQAYTSAEQRLRAALVIARDMNNRLLEGRCTRYLGLLAEQQLQFTAAGEAYARALAIYRDPAVGDVAGQIDTLLNLASFANVTGDFTLAQQHYTATLKLAEKANARPQQCNALSGLGWLYRTWGRLDDALAAQQQALAIAEGADDLWTRASVYHAIAVLYSDFGQNDTGIDYANKAIALYVADDNAYGQVLVENALGVYYYRQGDYAQSATYLHASLARAEKLTSQGDILSALTNLGELALRQGDYAKGRAYLQRALPINTALRSRTGAAELHVLLARVGRLDGDAQRAKAPAKAAALYAQAATHLRDSLATARALQLPAAQVEALMESALLQQAQGKTAEALTALAKAIALAEPRQFRHQLWELYFHRARALRALGRLREAEMALRQAIAVLDVLEGGVAGGERGKETFVRSRIKVFEMMAEVLGAINAAEKDPAARRRRAEEALQYVARARFQVASTAARTVQDTGNDALDQALRRRDDVVLRQAQLEKEAQSALEAGNTDRAAKLDRVIARTVEELSGTYADIKAQDADLDARLKFDPRRLADAVEELPDGAVLLVLFPGQDSLHLWVYTHAGFTQWRQRPIGRTELYGLVQEFRAGIDEVISHIERRERIGRGFGPAAEANAANPAWYRENITAMRKALGALYGHLITPVEAELAGANPLIVLPYGQLCYLPFEALTRESADGKISFLGQQRRITYLTGEDHLREMLRAMQRPLTDKPDAWVAFADPRGRLASSLTEAEDIAAFYPTHEIHSNVSGTAGKDQVEVLREDCTILHFATHGFLNGTKPSQTYLELATPPGDGMLTQSEIWPRLKNLSKPFKNRRLRLVVLSACETARGQQAPEAEVLGLPDAFTMAGVPAVVGSLWSVYTYTTTDLMVEFYRVLAQQKANKIQALQQARQAMIAKDDGRYAHPFYWAPFLLFGDWR